MDNYALDYQAAQKAVEFFAVGDRNLCWGSMVYACVGMKWPRLGQEKRPACGHEERYYLAVGVEGPPVLRAVVLEATKRQTKQGWEDGWAEEHNRLLESIGGVSYIPVPFSAGRCPKCGGAMEHVRWQEDEVWNSCRRPPRGARYFRVPDGQKAWRYATQGYGGAELVTA